MFSSILKPTFFYNYLILSLVFSSFKISGQMTIMKSQKWSERAAISVMNNYPKAWQIDDNKKPKWDYKMGFLLFAFDKLYQKTNNYTYLNYIKEYTDELIESSGEIKGYNVSDYNIDFVNPGNVLFTLYDVTKEEKYNQVMLQLRDQIKNQPRTASGGFWHKEIYPNQLWVDGLYMAEPFYTRYTVGYENGDSLDDIALQFSLVHDHFTDERTGLLYQCWDESKQMAWADPKTGTSPTIWGRGIGWYMMALVDVLDYYPKNHPKQKLLVSYLKEIAQSVLRYKTNSGLWYQVTDKPMLKGNYLESSASAMFIYAYSKAANNGYLSSKYKKQAQTSFVTFIKEFVSVDEKGNLNIKNVSPSIGLGGNPFRDGSNAYYITGRPKENGSPALAAFILSAIELDK